MKTILIFLIVILSFVTLLSAQWISFELDLKEDNFQQQAEPLLKSISLSTNRLSLSTNRHFFNPININKRINLGVSYSYGLNISGEEIVNNFGGYPNVAGQLIITENFLLKGNLSLFKSGDVIVQSFAYGFGLDLTKKENNYYRFSFLISRLQGPDDLRNRAIDAAIIYQLKIKSFPLFAGFGLNSYKTNILIDDINSIPASIKGNANYLLFGAQILKGRFAIMPILQVNSDVIMISIEIMGAFK